MTSSDDHDLTADNVHEYIVHMISAMQRSSAMVAAISTCVDEGTTISVDALARCAANLRQDATCALVALHRIERVHDA